MIWEMVILLVLIMGNGVFALAEIALVSAKKTRLEQLESEGNVGAAKALQLMEDPNRFLSTVQVGITLVGTLAAVFGGARFGDPLAEWLVSRGMAARYAEPAALGVVVLVITYLSLTLGELVPKRVALHNPEKISLLVSGPMKALSRAAHPLVAVLSLSTDLFLRLLPLKANDSANVTEDDIRAMIHEGASTGVLSTEEQDMLNRLLRLDDRRVSVLMTPRRELVYFDRVMPRAEVMSIIQEQRYSRYPVCGESIDEVLGIVHLRDLLAVPTDAEEIDFAPMLAQPLFVIDSTRALALLRLFKSSGVHIAIVQDEFGGVEGIVTINDIFESIVGSIPELGEEEENPVVQREDGSWLVSGSLPLDEAKFLFLDSGCAPEPEAGYKTFGGFVMTQLERVPAVGDYFQCGRLRFEVVDMDDRRVDKVLIERLPEETEAVEAPEHPA